MLERRLHQVRARRLEVLLPLHQEVLWSPDCDQEEEVLEAQMRRPALATWRAYGMNLIASDTPCPDMSLWVPCPDIQTDLRSGVQNGPIFKRICGPFQGARIVVFVRLWFS